jgi:hypothetical protein
MLDRSTNRRAGDAAARQAHSCNHRAATNSRPSTRRQPVRGAIPARPLRDETWTKLADAVDLLRLAIERVRPLLADTKRPTKERVRILWSAVKHSRDLAASDVVADDFARLAVEVGLIDAKGWWTGEDVREDRRQYGREDIDHVIRWGLLGLNPFETGPLQ